MLPTVRTFMDTDTHAIEADQPILEAVARLIDEGVTGAPVVRNGAIVGMLTELECLRLVTEGDAEARFPEGTVADFMRPVPALTSPDMDIYHVAGLFLKTPNERRFPVLQGDKLVGVITRKDILRAVETRIGA